MMTTKQVILSVRTEFLKWDMYLEPSVMVVVVYSDLEASILYPVGRKRFL